jgi:hypothetical protein
MTDATSIFSLSDALDKLESSWRTFWIFLSYTDLSMSKCYLAMGTALVGCILLLTAAIVSNTPFYFGLCISGLVFLLASAFLPAIFDFMLISLKSLISPDSVVPQESQNKTEQTGNGCSFFPSFTKLGEIERFWPAHHRDFQ